MSHRSWSVLLAAYSLLLAAALFWPSSTLQSRLVEDVERLVINGGVPATVATYTRMEIVMNALIVVPATFLGSMAFRRWNWRDWTAAGFVAAVFVELTQGVFLSGREAAISDVVANTAGALLGAVVARLARPMLRTRRSR